ncbi:RNA-binding protein Cwf29 [Coemansia furcata]|uniref:RNA-binding protein Cwf29 n=1 Tax=Coemansia furcata TaxID=417177 RepID=A0ACC1LMB4_9FUNG|nr:RNA-binding protein Cwf29 [Coemansia furcata]
MNVVQEIRRINERESRQGSSGSTASWHDEYKDSAYIFVGGLPFDLTEGDIICVFSQYGEIVNINLVRDKETGKSKGYAFLQYEDQRSTILAVDNLNGAKVLGRVLRVDHVKGYRQPKGEELAAERVMNAAPAPVQVEQEADSDEVLMQRAGIDPEDPMAGYYLDKYKRKLKKEGKREEGSKEHRRHRRDKERDSHRHRHRETGELETGHIKDERRARSSRQLSNKNRTRSRSP